MAFDERVDKEVGRVKLKPIGERALVKPVEREEKTESGIVLPETARGQQQTAEVIAVGDSNGVGVNEGDTVLFARFSGTSIKLGEEEHLLLDFDDLLGIVEK